MFESYWIIESISIVTDISNAKTACNGKRNNSIGK